MIVDRRHQQGFTILELAIAAFLFAFGLLGLVTVQTRAQAAEGEDAGEDAGASSGRRDGGAYVRQPDQRQRLRDEHPCARVTRPRPTARHSPPVLPATSATGVTSCKALPKCWQAPKSAAHPKAAGASRRLPAPRHQRGALASRGEGLQPYHSILVRLWAGFVRR